MSVPLSPDLAGIERDLDSLLDRSPTARVLGLRAASRRPWPEVIERRGLRFRLAWCASELELREQLDGQDGATDGIVVLTPIDPEALGADVVARMPRGRLVQPDRWTALRGAFKAKQVDPRLRVQRWIADLLLTEPPVGGYSPAEGDVLDLETAWRAVLRDILNFGEARVDAADLLRWTLEGTGPSRFVGLPDEARVAARARLIETSGEAGALVLRCVEAGRGADATAMALACGVVFGGGEEQAPLRDAAIRLERFVGGAKLEAKAGTALAEAGSRVLKRLVEADPASARGVQAAAEAVLSEVGALDYVGRSPALLAGLEARMVEAARLLAVAAATGGGDDAGRAWDAVERARRHDRAGEQLARLDRLVMAARLSRWLSIRPDLAPRSLRAAAYNYAHQGGYADRARHAMRSGDELPEIASAYARLREQATARREKENEAFAACLRDWMAEGATGIDPLPVEAVLDTVVVPIAAGTPVLLLVLDGLSFAVWRALAETVARLGWTEAVRQDGTISRIGVAVLPSVTEVSRASLLGGTLGRGDQGYERARFASHPAMVRASRGGKPSLFHKADLGSGPELDSTLRGALADPGQRVVGLVHNAVDAQLSGSDQIDIQWSTEALRQITAILRIARDAGRVLIVTGDHGHVLDEGTTLGTPGSGGRWREAASPNEGEVFLSGNRVRSPSGGRSVVATWTERLRNGSPRGGYHGGASPQEVLVPIAVFCAAAPPAGWVEAAPGEPSWWYGRPEPALAPRLERDPEPAGQRRPDPPQADLFARPAERAPAPPSPTPDPPWIDLFLQSAAYAAQQRLAARAAPRDEQISPLLAALARRGGRLSLIALAQALALPVVRVRSLVHAARRVLNLDQAAVLRLDGDDVVLDEALLRAQFGLETP